MSISRTARTPRKLSRDIPAAPVLTGNAVPHIHLVSSAATPGPHVRSVSIEDNPIAQFFKTEQRNSLLVCGDSEKALASVPDGVFQTCVTSPPYWSLRDYHIAGQIGLENSVSDYIAHCGEKAHEMVYMKNDKNYHIVTARKAARFVEENRANRTRARAPACSARL